VKLAQTNTSAQADRHGIIVAPHCRDVRTGQLLSAILRQDGHELLRTMSLIAISRRRRCENNRKHMQKRSSTWRIQGKALTKQLRASGT